MRITMPNDYDHLVRALGVLALIAFAVLVYFILGLALGNKADAATLPQQTIEPLFTADPLPTTPTFENHPTIVSMTAGIVRAKRRAGVWFQCGSQIPRDEWPAVAEEWAVEIWQRHVETGAPLRDFLGLPAQESGFDPCALGPYPREWAYQNGWLKPSRRTLSHHAADIAAFLRSRDWRRETGGIADLGGYQVLHPKYTGKTRLSDLALFTPELAANPDYNRSMTTAELMTIRGSVLSGARQLAIRQVRFGTKRPGACWPGRYSPSYRAKLDRWVDRVMKLRHLP